MLAMPNILERKRIERYFYGGGSWWESLLPNFIVGIIRFLLSRSSRDEHAYDEMRLSDEEYLKERAAEMIGLTEEELSFEEYSLIDPIVAIGFVRSDCSIEKAWVAVAEKKDFLQRMWNHLMEIPMAIYRFIRSLFEKKDVISRPVYYEGLDGKVRCSIISFTIIAFTDKQIVSYNCNYDIALGIILEEYVSEAFYRDVDSVSYGDETLHILNDVTTTVERVTISTVNLTIPSGRNIVASISGDTDLLSNQVVAMKNLIRSKKEEMA